MNVLFVSNLFPNCHEPARGIFNLHQVRHLARRCPVRVVAPIAWFPVPGRFAPPARVPEREQVDGLTVLHPKAFYLPKIGRPLNPWLFATSLRGLLDRVRHEFPFDVILVNWSYPDACGVARLAKRLRVPFVASVSGSDANWYLQMRFRRRQILAMFAQATAITVRSQALRELLLAHGVAGEKIHVIYNGVDRELFAATPKPDARKQLGLLTTDNTDHTDQSSGTSVKSVTSVAPSVPASKTDDQGSQEPLSAFSFQLSAFPRPLLLYVGRLSPEKGVADLIRALAILRNHHQRPARLLVVGDGMQREELWQIAVEQGVQEAITWVGWKKPAEIAACLSAADLVCLPSHMEGVPNVALEAFACGRPVVATRVGGIPEVVTEAVGILTEPRDPGAFAAALAFGLQANWDAAAIRQYAARFDWNENARQVYEVLLAANETKPGLQTADCRLQSQSRRETEDA